uniref:Spectrin repeat containing nuclear envelope protein 2 n=1 Tax=Coturnix japonica TaxID=93934 RepID=A0A8C2T0X3_COTJA
MILFFHFINHFAFPFSPVQRECTQKKTFTTWINSILAKHTPPSVISDLYTDIQQGHMLLDLLEVLSGQHLPREKGFNTFQCRSNIENALTFLRNKSLKLINIHVADIIEGKPSIVLGLIWTIIFHFHIEELARTLACTYSQPSLDCSSTVDSSPKAKRSAKRSAKIKERWKMSATKALLLWAKEQCSLYGSISVTDFKSSWRSGLPFLAIINALRPGLIDLEKAKARSNKENLDEAFRIAELELNIPRLLEPEDVDVMNPDEKSIMTYVAQFLQYSRNMPETEDMQEMMSFMEAFNQEKKAFLPLLSSKRSEAELSEGQQQMREEWSKLISQINEWKAELDQMLPPPLDGIEAWLQQVEHLQTEDLPDLQDPFKAMSLFSEIISVFKGLMNSFDSHLDTLQSFENKDEKNMPLIVPEKLEEMKRRFSDICFTNSTSLLEYHYGLCSAFANEVTLKLNIWDVKYGTKESVESLLENWNKFVEEKRLKTQLETATRICEDLKNKNISKPDLGKFLCIMNYISNVNTTLQKVLSSWSSYTENLYLLKTWLEEKQNEYPIEVSADTLANWNSVHGSLNEAGNYLIEVSKEQVGSNIAKELKKLNRRWAKFIKKTRFSLAARGILCQEQVMAAEEILQSLMKNASSQVSQQHCHTTGLPARIKEARDRIEVLLLYCYCTLCPQFLAVHNEIISCVQLLLEREKKKFNTALKKINKQLGKEKKLLNMNKTKGLIKEHEVRDPLFSADLFLFLNALSFLLQLPLVDVVACVCEIEPLFCVNREQRPPKLFQICNWLNELWFMLFLIFINRKTCLTSGRKRELDQSVNYSIFVMFHAMSGVFSCHFPNLCFFTFSYRTNSLRTALEIVLPIENESILLHELDQRLNKKGIQQFNLMNSDLAYRELKELQRSILNQIEVCKQLEHLDSSARNEFNPIDLQAASKIMFYYQNQLEEMSHRMQIRETVLKDLEAFMASLRKIKSSVDHLTDPVGQPEIRGKTWREAAQELSHMAKEAQCLDERLKTVDICLEDAECGRNTSCEKLVQTLSEELKVSGDHSSEQMLAEGSDLYKVFSTRNEELLKNIQDLRDRINKIGLKDPTVPAIQQRIKSLMELEKELDCSAVEMKSVREIANKLLQMKEEKAEESNEQCRVTERSWEDTKLLLAECQEQCVRALELLKQYHSCKSSLTSIIQKQETVLSQQNSYMGKDNLNRLITKIEEAKEEFNDHAEDVDKINQICKNLQFQLNKMRSFEEPPFENEANIIVDRWLDINEKTENYCDNLGRAQALWDKLLGLSGTIDAWANAELQSTEGRCLTDEDLTQLKHDKKSIYYNFLHFSFLIPNVKVIRSSIVQKMELIKDLLTTKQRTSELSVNTAELKGDLDLAKTQIGMTESLLKALSPSDTLEIFTKLEEIHQKILQQKHHVTLLQEETDCPDVDELNKQLKCVTDLFNKKKHVFQDHFIGVLNRQCKNFNDWFSSTQLSLKDCFDPSETKQMLEERLQRLKHFLTSEGKDGDIQEVKTLLNKVKNYLPKASIHQLSSRVRDQEAELQRLISKCQKREKELGTSLQQLNSLQESSTVLEKWLTTQEEKLQEIKKDETKLENLYKTLLMQREPFDSLAQLANSLRETGLTEDEIISETGDLVSRYQTLMTNVNEMAGNTQGLAVDEHFKELAQDMSSWIKKLEKAINNLSSQESELTPDERINQIKEIIALKDAGDAKIQNIVPLGETLIRNDKIKKPEVQQTVSDLQNQWERTCQLVTYLFLSLQEQLLFNREQCEQSKEGLRLALIELKKQQQEMGFALQPGLLEKQAQLASYTKLLQRAEDLTSQFYELESQDHLQSLAENSCFTEESWLELKHQHENLLSQLQAAVETLERHVQEHQQFEDMVTSLSTELKTASQKLADCASPTVEQPSTEQKQLKSQVSPLCRFEDMLKKILVLAETVKQNTSSPGQKFIEDEIETLQSEHRSLEEKLENVKQKKENSFSEALELKDDLTDGIQMENKTDTMLKREMQITSDTPINAEEGTTTEELRECLEMHNVSVFLNSNDSGGLVKETSYFEEEQKVNELKNEVAELDIVLINEQLKELENLQTELETWKAKSLCLSRETLPDVTGSHGAELQTPEPVVPCWDRLLQELDAVKSVKKQQCCLVNEYQKNLSAAQSSMKNLSTEKDNIKMGPMNNTVLLEKIKACVQSLHKERDVLNQLKAQQELLSQHLTRMDKVLTASQMMQLEQWWQHMEQAVQKKHDQVLAEINEFNTLMDKAQDIQRLIQEQYLQTDSCSSDGEKAKCPIIWTAELQNIKHGLSLLKRKIELQMKRIWSDEEKMALESCIQDLQSKLEALTEQCTPQDDVRVTGPAVRKQDIMKKLKENMSWVKDLLSSLDQKAALFPCDVKSQIRNCELVRNEILDREPVIETLGNELQHILPNLKPEEISDMTSLLQALQNSYKALVLKSVERLQHLELQLEERQRLIAEVEKVHCQLRNAETLGRPDMNRISTCSELISQQDILKEILKDIQEIEGLISSHCEESQITAGELSLSEQLFLIDQLRSLKNRARKTKRQIQSKCHEVGKKIAVYKEFAEGITSLQQDLSDLQSSELKLEELTEATQEIKNKCKALEEKVLSFQSNLSQIMKFKEIFECIGLNWDSFQLDELRELQTQFFRIKDKIKGKITHFGNIIREYDKLHALLNDIRTMTSAVRKEADILNDRSNSSPAENLISAQILLQTIQQMLHLIQEAANQINESEVFHTPFKESKRKEIKSLEKDVEGLSQILQNLVSSLQSVNKEDIHNVAEHLSHAIKRIQSELQQPLLVDMKMMQYEKMRWESIQYVMSAEFSAIKLIMEKERESQGEKSLAADIETKLRTLADHEIQLKTDIAARVAGELYTKAVERAARFLEDCEAQLCSAAVELSSSEDTYQTPQWKQEEFDSAKADLEQLYSKLKNIVKPEDKISLENTLRELVNKSLALKEKIQRNEADKLRYLEKYKSYSKCKDKVCDDLNNLGKMLGQSLSQIPMSYKEALENLQECKILVSNIDSAEDDLVKLRQVSGELMRLCKGSDRALGRIVTALWENWLGLLEAAKELEINCEELKQEWKFINEELEREAIILDKLQEEQPESLKEKEKATREELVELLDSVYAFEENVSRQQLLLLLLLHRIRNILNTPENVEAEVALPALCEIKTMQDRCKKLYEKTQDHKNLVQAEIQERNKITEEINAVKNVLQNALSVLSQDAVEKAAQLKEAQRVIDKESQNLKDIMEKLRIRYSEMYTIVPAETEAQLEDCKKTLQDLEDKVSFENLQSSPQYVLKGKAETINNGLQAIEKMLEQKSENVAKAKEVQKQIWDMLDLWHYKLNELDAEVHDIVEQDSCHAQDLMDILMTPLQHYQQVSQLAERRTAILNKAANKMEEYDELLKDMKVWIENTNSLLRADAQNDSAKRLHKYTNGLQMALEDSEQKQNLLHSVYLELEELTPVFETDSIMQQLNEAEEEVAILQQEITEILPQIQHVADELGAIEAHVKMFEKDVMKMKTILSSEDLLELPPKDQLKHGQVILDHIGPMQKTIVHIQSYEEALQLPGVKKQPVSVFLRAKQLLRELKKIEEITKEQNELLEEAVKKTEECEQEIEKLKQFLQNHLAEKSHEYQPQTQKASCPEVGFISRPKFMTALDNYVFGFFSCALLQSGTCPPVPNATQGSQGKEGDPEEAVDGGRPEPETILQACKAQVAELEQWLDKTKVSLGSDPHTPKMQQMVELQLGDFQVMLSQIEQKVHSLLEDGGKSVGHQQEAEDLSSKLKEVKCNLEKVQMMLQDKYNEEQVKHMNSVLRKSESSVVAEEQLELTTYNKEGRRVNQKCQTCYLFALFALRYDYLSFDQTGNKWQYLQQELSSKMKSPLCQLVEPQVCLNSVKHSSTVEELKTYTVQLGDLSQEANVVHAQENVAEEVSSNLDKKLFELLLAISRCLDNMEEMLNTSVLSTEEAAVQQVLYETLSVELQKLHADLSDKKDDLLKSITCAGGSTDVFCECFNNLQAWLEQTQAATASRSNSVKAGLDHNTSYQNETRLLYDQLTEKKATLQQCLNAIRGHNVSEQLQKTDACALELQNFENQVAKLRGYGERFQLPVTLIQEAYKLEDVLDDMWGILKAKYMELNSSSISENQYEDLLNGFVELVAIGQEKIAQDTKQLTKSRAALQSHLKNHKDFFHNLMTHMAFMQAFSKKVTPSVQQKREKFWRGLVNEVKLLEQKASQYGIHLESLLKEWTEFDDEYLAFSKELEALTSMFPSVNLVEETEERLMERIALLQQIKSSVDEKHARLYQMVKEGKKLLTAVSCPEITSQIGKLEEQWLSLTKKVGNELHRLQTLLKLLVSYNRDSEELRKWLDSAEQRMKFWKEQSLNVSQDLPTIRDNIDSLFAFSKEVDDKSSLKSSVVSTANQLFHVKQGDTAGLRSSLAKFEQKWGELITQLPAIQEKLHQLQMEKLSSREAIAELMTWLDHVEKQQGHEEQVNTQNSAAQDRSLLQKYKEYMMEMNFKQWMVDFVNQSLLQMSTCDVESKRYERTEFAECLGEVNLRWHRLQASLNRKIQDLEHLLEDTTENENKAQTLYNWLEAQSDRMRSLQTPASLTSAQNTLDDCKDLENQLAIKSKILDELKQCVSMNGSTEQTPEALSFRIADLCEMKDSVVSQVAQLKTSMQSILEQWRVYDDIYAEVSLLMTRYLYCIDQCKPSVLSLEALKNQVKTLQSLQDELENSEESWAKLQAAANNLKKNCSPSFAEIIDQKCTEAHTRWSSVNEDITDQLRTAHATLQLWEPYDSLCTEAAAKLQQHEEQCTQLLDARMPEDNMIETLKQRIQDVKNLQHGLQSIVECRSQISELADQIKHQAGTTAQAILLEKLQPLQRASYLEKMLQRKLDELQCVNFFTGHFDCNQLPFYFQNHTLELAALSPSIESLNEASLKLPLSDFTLKKMQSLTRQWSQKTATALEHCSVLEGTQTDEKKFLQKCENWMKFLEKMKEALKSDVPGRFEELQEQQRVYEMLQTEISINQQTFNSIIAKVLLFLESGEAEKRTEFISKLTLLKEQWQNVTWLVQQRKKDIDGLVSQWQLFRSSLRSLSRFLADTNSFLTAVKSQDCYSLYHLRNLIHDFKSKAVILQRWQGMYSSVIDVGEKLRTDSDPETSDALQEELSQLQQSWGDTQVQLEKMKTWDSCEKQTKELESRLRELKDEVKDPLPVEHEELYKSKEHIKELEQSLADWAHNMKELQAMKAELAHCILTEDMMVLQEQVEHLHRQWEELCLRVSLRKQEIEDRLNAWIVFNEKNKELCSWLVQMESKVLQTADVSIEDMIDKLQKDCMEEINLFSENKLHLKQMGDQLIKASNKNRVAEIDDKLNKINDRWQHLFDVIGARVKKLKETFAFIQLLDKNMSNLRTWLARIESELSKPVVYDICDDQEIQKRLAEQQDLQRDIEQHTAGVESVFNICEVLLHDSDACANETECDSIQQTSRSLDRRWRNICAMSMERRMKIEETWRLWQRFLDDYSRFEDWLKSAERTAASPNSSEVLYTHAKEELKKFEAFQRQIHERLTQLELINKQYRRLARENRTDSASKLKQMVHEGNQRWDNLQKRVAAILRRLKHFTNRRDEFEATRENILVWLTEMDLQLTNVEHFSKSNFDDKMRQLNGFQQEITLHTNKIDQLIVFGEQLIQKSEPLDAILIEDELEELHRYCQEVFGRVARFHQRLTSRHPGLDDEKETSENETDPEDSREIQNDPWHKKAINEEPSSPQSLCHLMPPTQGHERSGCETPVSVDSIPLEWDHTGDVGGSSSHEDEEEATYYSALSGKAVSEAHPWHSPESPVCRKHRYNQAEIVGDVLSGPETSTPYKPGYVTKKQKLSAKSDSRELSMFVVLSLAGIIDRWELIQAQDLRNKLRIKQHLQQWQQVNSDLSDVSAWLDKTEEELEELRKAKPPTSMQAMEQRVKKLKDILKAFDNYKAVVLSVNLSSKEFQKADSTEFKELQNRLRKVNLRWEKATHALDNWRKGLRQALLQCQVMLLWDRYGETEGQTPTCLPNGCSQYGTPQLEKELLEQQLKVNSLQELSAYLLLKSDGEDYIEADEKVHVIGKKLKQLIEQVSHDLKTVQGSLDSRVFLPVPDDLDSEVYHPVAVKSSPPVKKATESHTQPTHVVPRSPSFFYRVLRAALPLQLFFLLLLLLACMIPSSEEDYSCTQANNFARSFYLMLRYTDGPPPT